MGKVVIASFIWAILVIGSIHSAEFKGSVPHFLKITNGETLLDIKPAFSEKETYQRIENYGEDGRAIYKIRLVTLDVLLPVSLFLFFYFFFKYSQGKLGSSNRSVKLLLMGASGFLAFDLIENLFVFCMLSDYPNRLSIVATVTPYVSILKRVSSFLGLFMTLYLVILTGLKRRNKAAR